MTPIENNYKVPILKYITFNLLLSSKQCLPIITKIIYKYSTLNFVACFPNVLPVEEQSITNLLVNSFDRQIRQITSK